MAHNDAHDWFDEIHMPVGLQPDPADGNGARPIGHVVILATVRAWLAMPGRTAQDAAGLFAELMGLLG